MSEFFFQTITHTAIVPRGIMGMERTLHANFSGLGYVQIEKDLPSLTWKIPLNLFTRNSVI